MERLIKAKVGPGRVALHWLGQSGFALKGHAGQVIVVDPYLSDSANADGAAARLVDIPVRPKDVRLDYLFLTHDHIDHTDPQTAPAVAGANPGATVVCPPSSARHLARLGVPGGQVRTAMPGDALEFPGFTAHVVAAHHSEDSVGYVFAFGGAGGEADAVTVYVTGDTEYSDALAPAVARFGPDVLLAPINGRWGNMGAAQAARLAAEVAPQEVIPTHYGMFATNTADPAEFLACLAAATGPDSAITPVVMRHNACHIFCPDQSAQGKRARKQARAARARQGRAGGEHPGGRRAA